MCDVYREVYFMNKMCFSDILPNFCLSDKKKEFFFYLPGEETPTYSKSYTRHNMILDETSQRGTILRDKILVIGTGFNENTKNICIEREFYVIIRRNNLHVIVWFQVFLSNNNNSQVVNFYPTSLQGEALIV